ncbi:hypothetical protein JKP88DRAFT_284165 [Tribonema minus]|uniref:Small EDRK-rich factor-like N-terminal domain-containing protein n=1 Tax=Tribonema minus TaxID=303371 RepID=A0A835ZDV9_9STRA|nr:hypothetical protein JKP88DRAFT_284165 [Tribonema minus]
MARGNQREIDRKRAENRSKRKAKADGMEGNPLARKERDAKALQEKIAKKQAAAGASGDAAK